MRTEVWATFGGWSYLPDYPVTADLDRGEIFKLADQPNDRVLRNLKYVLPVESGASKFQCDTCGRRFIGEDMLYAHKKKTNCMDSQDGTSQGMGKADVAKILDVDVDKVQIEDPKPHFVDTHTTKLGGESEA